ncbi:MAG: sulfite exporter TauE/SafE family protein, partial [Caulobacteraceae bacterium]|nr:sulfite exporter TauE/SafE family protein [Caulobacter sp.]
AAIHVAAIHVAAIHVAAWQHPRLARDDRRRAERAGADEDDDRRAEPEAVRAHPHRHDAHEAEGVDAHGRAHANDIANRFRAGQATTAQIVAFGLTGGLVPCPAAVTVLLLCLQLKRFVLAVALVACFSVGVAATMIAAGVVAALGLRGARARWPGLDAWAARAPYASGALMIAVALYMAVSGWLALGGAG